MAWLQPLDLVDLLEIDSHPNLFSPGAAALPALRALSASPGIAIAFDELWLESARQVGGAGHQSPPRLPAAVGRGGAPLHSATLIHSSVQPRCDGRTAPAPRNTRGDARRREERALCGDLGTCGVEVDAAAAAARADADVSSDDAVVAVAMAGSGPWRDGNGILTHHARGGRSTFFLYTFIFIYLFSDRDGGHLLPH